jgi:hypothetical protein
MCGWNVGDASSKFWDASHLKYRHSFNISGNVSEDAGLIENGQCQVQRTIITSIYHWSCHWKGLPHFQTHPNIISRLCCFSRAYLRNPINIGSSPFSATCKLYHNIPLISGYSPIIFHEKPTIWLFVTVRHGKSQFWRTVNRLFLWAIYFPWRTVTNNQKVPIIFTITLG